MKGKNMEQNEAEQIREIVEIMCDLLTSLDRKLDEILARLNSQNLF
jgi:hypothetical protein